MNSVKINYLGFGIQTLDTTNLVDAIYHLGAKYGAMIYNKGLNLGAIKVDQVENLIEVDVDKMNQIISEN